jgi:glycosyltransferase involved in cell wall biosynthesis
MNARPSITVVIPTLNEERNLPKCLAAIGSQDYPKELVEIIVVDNGSEDRTVEIARAAGATVLRNEIRDAEVSKMMGLRAAKSDCFIYLDADIELASKDVLARLAEPLREDGSLAGAFPRFAARSDAPAMDRYLHYHPLELDPVLEFLCASIGSVTVERREKWSVCDFSRKRVPPVGICLYRRDILLKALEGRERFMDIDVPVLAAKAGHPRFACVPEAKIYHPNIASLPDLVRRRLRNLHKVFLPSEASREFRYLPPGLRGVLKAALLALLANTPFYFLFRGIVRSIRRRDAACLYEPLAACALTDALLLGMLRDAAGRRFIKTLFGGGKST